MTRVTLDTNILPAADLIEAARNRGFDFARVTVTDREVEGTRFEIDLVGLGTILESGEWDESEWDRAVWASEDSLLEEILQIISSGSFPPSRENLSAGQQSQLRDAMILEAHGRKRRDIFVSNDERAFIRHGRRELLQEKVKTQIFTREEFDRFLRLALAGGMELAGHNPFREEGEREMRAWEWNKSTRILTSGHWPELVEGLRAAIIELRDRQHAPQGFDPVEVRIRPSATGKSYTVTIVYEECR